MANITGWGRGTWSEGAWSEGLPVELTGIQSNTSVGTAQSGVGPDVAVTGNLISSKRSLFFLRIHLLSIQMYCLVYLVEIVKILVFK